jgi:integrase
LAKALTVKAVESAKADGKRCEIADGHTRGLYLVVQPSGLKGWVFRYRFTDKPRKLTIGPLLDERKEPVDGPLPLGAPHTLAEARIAAQAARVAVGLGTDPGAAKVEAKKARLADPTSDLVETYAKTFITQHCKPNNRSWAETDRQFKTTILPVIGKKRVREVTKADVVGIRDKLIDAAKPIMANRVFATLRKFFNWLVGRGTLEISPCVGLAMPSAEMSRDRVLSWSELAALWSATANVSEPFGQLIRTLILTLQRREEVGALNDAELERERLIWTIPAERAKNGKAHVVPITGAILAEIDGARRVGKKGIVFSTTGETSVSGFSKTKRRLDEALQFNVPWTFHDIRRTGATGMAELGEPIHVVEAVLNHKSGTIKGVAAVYNRHDYFQEKQRAITAWGRFIADVIANEQVRLAYGRMKDRRPFIEAIHADDDAHWLRYVEGLKPVAPIAIAEVA